MRGKWLVGLIAAALFAAAAGFVYISRKARPVPRPVSLPSRAAVPREIVLTGTVQARTVVKLAAPVQGTLDRFLVNTGDAVYEGQLLAVVRNPKLSTAEQLARLAAQKAQARVTELESALIAGRLEASRARADATRAKLESDAAEKVYRRQELLNRDGATPRLTFEKAEKEYTSLKAAWETAEEAASQAENHQTGSTADLEGARGEAKRTEELSNEAQADLGAGDVHCPADGIVLSRRGKPGDPVEPSMDNLFEIGTNLAALRVAVTPGSDTMPLIKTGQRASVEIAGNAVVPATVSELSAGHASVDFTSPASTIKPGAAARVRITIEQRP